MVPSPHSIELEHHVDVLGVVPLGKLRFIFSRYRSDTISLCDGDPVLVSLLCLSVLVFAVSVRIFAGVCAVFLISLSVWLCNFINAINSISEADITK